MTFAEFYKAVGELANGSSYNVDVSLWGNMGDNQKLVWTGWISNGAHLSHANSPEGVLADLRSSIAGLRALDEVSGDIEAVRNE